MHSCAVYCFNFEDAHNVLGRQTLWPYQAGHAECNSAPKQPATSSRPNGCSCLSRRDVSATCQHQRGNHKTQLHLLAECSKCSKIPSSSLVTELYFYWIHEASAPTWLRSLPAATNSSVSLACKDKTPSHALHTLAVLM